MIYILLCRLEEIGYKGVEYKCESQKDDEVIPIEMLTIKNMNELTDKGYIEVFI